MQVDLFEPKYLRSAHRLAAQITSRSFSIQRKYKNLGGLDQYFRDEKQCEQYKDYLKRKVALLDDPEFERYSHIGTANCDKLYDLETLAVGEYFKTFSVVLDFSDCLDYILHRLYGCKIADIRSVPNYSEISRAILNFNFGCLNSSITFAELLDSSVELRDAMALLSKEAQEREQLRFEEQAPWVLYQFCLKCLQEVGNVKMYAMVAVANNNSFFDTKGIIRSTSYSSILATANNYVNEPILLHQNIPEIDDYEVMLRSYGAYEYFGEVIRQNEFSWKI